MVEVQPQPIPYAVTLEASTTAVPLLMIAMAALKG